MTVAVESLYLVRNSNGTVDTVRTDFLDPETAHVAYAHGAIREVRRGSSYVDMHLDATALELPAISPN